MNTPIRVMVVEDDHDLAEYARLVLAKYPGITVDVVADGRTAIDTIRKTGTDILISDIQLPGMTGLELATEARRVDPAMPIAMMTGYPSVDYAVTALRNQIDEFLIKPVSAGQFAGTLRSLIDLRKERDAASRSQVVLAIGAHPDDVEIGVGGLLAAHRAAGDAVVILTMSRGARGGDAGAGSTSRLPRPS